MGRVIMSGIVPLLSKPVKGTALSKLDEGAIIKINEGGNLVEFYLAKHNYEPDLNGSGRELIVRKDCYDLRQWDTSNVNTYANSAIDTWLNGTYKNLLNASVQEIIGTTKFKYTPGNYDWDVVPLERAFFLLSATEIGYGNTYGNIEGSELPIASILKIAYMNGSTQIQWTRSPVTDQGDSVIVSSSSGAISYYSPNANLGSRPCFTLPSTAKIDDTGLLIG